MNLIECYYYHVNCHTISLLIVNHFITYYIQPSYSGFRIRKARVRKCNRFPRQKGGPWSPGVPCVDRGNWDENATLLARDRIRYFGKKGLASIACYAPVN